MENLKDLIKENLEETISSFPKLEKFPVVRLSGKEEKGVFVKNDGNKKVEIGKKLELYVFYQTNNLASFSPRYRRFSTEYRNPRTDEIILFEIFKNSETVNNIFTGKVYEAREKYEGLRTVINLYSITSEKEFIKFSFKGNSIVEWYNFLSKKEGNLEDYFLVVKPKLIDADKSETGEPYWVCQFSLGEPVDLDFLLDKNVSQRIKNFYNTMNKINELKRKVGIEKTTEVVHKTMNEIEKIEEFDNIYPETEIQLD